MADQLLMSEVKAELMPYLLRRLSDDSKHKFTDADLVNACNLIAQDMNVKAGLRVERYTKATVADEKNYEMAGEILEVMYFKYEADTWKDQIWTYLNDVIVFETAPAGAYPMDIVYLRSVAYVTIADADVIDLPSSVFLDFKELLKKKLLIDFEGLPGVDYESELEARVGRILERTPQQGLSAIPDMRYSAVLKDDKYDITDQWVSNNSVTVLDSGDVIFL